MNTTLMEHEQRIHAPLWGKVRKTIYPQLYNKDTFEPNLRPSLWLYNANEKLYLVNTIGEKLLSVCVETPMLSTVDDDVIMLEREIKNFTDVHDNTAVCIDSYSIYDMDYLFQYQFYISMKNRHLRIIAPVKKGSLPTMVLLYSDGTSGKNVRVEYISNDN